jgi:hypothetical protein
MSPMAMLGGVPPVQPPPGMVFVPGWGMVSMEALAQAQAQTAGGTGPRTGSQPQYGVADGGYAHRPGGYPTPPPAPKSMADQFREATSVIRLATEIAEEFRPQSSPVASSPDDSPIKVIDTGVAKIVVNKADGSARFWESAWANSDKIFKWLGEQHEAIQKAAKEREQARSRAPLPPSYVEVTPGYKPPPGMGIVPVAPMAPQPLYALPQQHQAPAQPPLPPPPAQVPPPITHSPQQADPSPRRSWDLPDPNAP